MNCPVCGKEMEKKSIGSICQGQTIEYNHRTDLYKSCNSTYYSIQVFLFFQKSIESSREHYWRLECEFNGTRIKNKAGSDWIYKDNCHHSVPESFALLKRFMKMQALL
jgi:hypothetical protein